MREVLVSDRIATAAAGRELIEIGALLSAGRVDDALARVDAVRARYPEWAELDQAIAGVESVLADRRRAEKIRDVVLEIVKALIGPAVRKAIGL